MKRCTEFECPTCGRQFVAWRTNQVYCTPACRRAMERKRRRIRQIEAERAHCAGMVRRWMALGDDAQVLRYRHLLARAEQKLKAHAG